MTSPPPDPPDERQLALSSALGEHLDASGLPTHLPTAIYLQCATLRRFRLQDLDTSGSSAEQVASAMRVLANRGLVSRLDDDSWAANPPEQALTDQAARLEQQAATFRAAAPGLARVYHEARARAGSRSGELGVELLTSLDEINLAMTELFATARRRVYSMRTKSPRVLAMMQGDPERAAALVRNSTGDILSLRVTFDATLIGENGLPSSIASRLRMDDIRFSRYVPFTATASDTGVTVMDLVNSRGTSVGVRISHPDVSAAIRQVIDDTWTRGSPWDEDSTSVATGGGPLDRRERQILRLLVEGVADAAIARQVGVSQRTVERRVRHILDLLGADTRFQAGVQAARRGWV